MPTVHIFPVTNVDDLFRHYPSQQEPQDCYLSLNLEAPGTMHASYNPEIGNGVPASVWHGRTLHIAIPCLTADAANALMERVKPLAGEIVDDTEIVWDGSNRVGRLGDAANAAYDKLAAMCDPACFSGAEIIGEYNAGDWFGEEGRASVVDRLGITAATTDEQIAQMATAEAEDAKTSGEGYTILTGAEEYLLGLREDLRETPRG